MDTIVIRKEEIGPGIGARRKFFFIKKADLEESLEVYPLDQNPPVAYDEVSSISLTLT